MPTPPARSDPVLVAAGDICSSPTNCGPTASLIDAINPDGVLTLGDNAYQDGSLAQYNSFYAPQWGRQNLRVFPAPGNHEYQTSGAAGYFAYFGTRAPAQYYSYNLGPWHLISLNSEISHTATSAETVWLHSDLAANAGKCILAYWHKPRFSSGTTHGSDSSFTPFWNELLAAHAAR